MTTITPMSKRVLVEMEVVKEKVEKGIILQSAETKRYEVVSVIAVASDVTAPKVGDKVLIDRYSGMEIESDGKKLFVIKAEDILAVVTE